MIGGASKLSPAFALALLTLATSPLLPPVTLMLSLLAPVTPMMALELLPEPLLPGPEPAAPAVPWPTKAVASAAPTRPPDGEAEAQRWRSRSDCSSSMS